MVELNTIWTVNSKMVTVLIFANSAIVGIVVIVTLVYFTDVFLDIAGTVTGSMITVFFAACFAKMSVMILGAIDSFTGHSCCLKDK
jgi:hypothetical protein